MPAPGKESKSKDRPAPRIRIGTASWSDPGFVQDWYPARLPAGDRLRYYADHFNLVEVNSTFYAVPDERLVARWVEETPADFIFDVKLFKFLSRHSAQAKFLPPDLRKAVEVKNGRMVLSPASEALTARRILKCLRPLEESAKLGALLLQLSPEFRPGKNNLEELDPLREILEESRLAVELRNRHWMTGDQAALTVKFFRDRRITLVTVDGPESDHFTVMPRTHTVTNPKLGYLRLHGRNAEGFVRGRTVAERFDYDYSEPELKEISGNIERWSEELQELHVILNNNRSNFAPKAARRLQELLSAKFPGLGPARRREIAEQLTFGAAGG